MVVRSRGHVSEIIGWFPPWVGAAGAEVLLSALTAVLAFLDRKHRLFLLIVLILSIPLIAAGLLFGFAEPILFGATLLVAYLGARAWAAMRGAERIVTDAVAEAVADMPGLIGHPAVRFVPYLVLICQVEQYADPRLVERALRDRIIERFREEGIEVPLPPRVLVTRQQEAGRVDA